MGPPGGGPEDKTPPEIVGISPISGSVRVAPDALIVFEFSETIDELTLRSSIFISPPQDKLRIKVKGRRVLITPNSGIPAERPMIITIGTGAKDLHGNPLSESMTIAITAGDSIFGGEVNGRIYGDPPFSGLLVGAWQVSDTLTISPDTYLAPFLTQSGDLGDFSLKYLPAGRYRIVCWEDKNRDKFYQPGIDRLGVAAKDVRALQDSSVSLDLIASRRDTLEFSLLLLLPIDNQHLQVRFTKKPDLGEIMDWLRFLRVQDSSGSELGLSASWADPIDSTRRIFLTQKQTENMRYDAVIEGDTSIFNFIGQAEPDTSGPKILGIFPTENARDVPLMANGSIAFDDAITGESLTTTLSLTVHDSISFPIIVESNAPNTLGWRVEQPLSTGERCLISLDLTKIFDTSGNVAGDSLRTLFFTTVDPAGTGELAGQVISNRRNNIIVAAKRLGNLRFEPQEVRASNIDGTFTIRRLSPGEYGLWCWEDRNANDKFDDGQLEPFQHSEPFTFLNDTVTVRARWESSGIILRLP